MGGLGNAGNTSKYENALFSTDFRQTQAASPEFFEAVSARRNVTVAKPGSDDLRFLDLMGADASAGGPGNMSILVRSEAPQRLTLTEEFLHGTQSKMWGEASLDAAGAETAFREWHVRDFMNRHSGMFGWDANELQSLQTELKYWAEKAGKSGR